jgi:hypothetical protein
MTNQSAALEAFERIVRDSNGLMEKVFHDEVKIVRQALTKIQPEQVEELRKAVAWLDEHGRIVAREENWGGGFVGNDRAIPDSWTPLYSDGGGK